MKADHRVLNPSRKFEPDGASDSKMTAIFTPKKSLSTPASNKAYETASGKKFMRSTQRSNTGEDESKYLTSEEIERLADPKASLAQLPTDLASKDWETQVNACNVLRSIAIHDSKVFDSSFFRAALPDILKIAASLRSSVSKNGLLALQDLFSH